MTAGLVGDPGFRVIRPARHRAARSLLAVALAFSPAALPGQQSDLLVSPGKLSSAHAEYSGLNNCQKCHTPGKKAVDDKCLACHAELAARIAAGRGYHRDKKAGCPKCHPDHQGVDFQMVEWTPREFKHAEAGYSLKGKHAAITDCHKCHNAKNSATGDSDRTYLVKSSRCGFCHEDVHKGQFAKDCDACHGMDAALKDIKFDHAAAAYPLKGAHREVACVKCHPGKKWKGLAFNGCTDCHRDAHRPTMGPACTKCHTEASWKVGTSYNHDLGRYPLRGRHAGLKCEGCHKTGKLEKIPFAACRDCHTKDPHLGQFAGDCGGCHDVSGFKPAKVDHQATRYPLTGKHAAVACVKCHFAKEPSAPVVYRPLKTGCPDCHKDAHLGQFTRTCEDCHSTLGFDRAALKFDHQRDSAYKLEGAHAPLKCEACHKKESAGFPSGSGEAVRYRPLPSECVTCHLDFHGGQLGRDCQRCHDFVRFKPAPGFSHEKTRFALDVLHQSLACDKCHPRERKTLAGKEVDIPKYKLAVTRCLDCHDRFDHSRTAYPLTGKHAAVDCGGCHTAKAPNVVRLRPVPEGRFRCQDCHSYRHPGKQENCANCHTTKSWAVDSD